MTTPHKLFIIQPQDRIVRVQKFGVEDNLDAIGGTVKQLHTADLVQDRVASIICHVVRYDRREGVALQRENTTLEEDLVFFREQTFRVGHFGSVFTVYQLVSYLLEQGPAS